MKNIHILPTENPSSLFEIDGHLIINREQLIQPKYYRNIYITSDEEINQQTKPCWCINTIKNTWNNDLIYYQGAMPQYHFKGFKKIILTTDQDLIEDGVQAIDDEFLEWFVKNPSCESVKTLWTIPAYKIEKEYRIEFPQEEPKQDNCEYIKEVGCIKDICTCNTGPNQQTFTKPDDTDGEWLSPVPSERAWQEEQLVNIFEHYPNASPKWQYMNGLIQNSLDAKKMYSEEELRNAMNWMLTQYFEFHEWPAMGRVDHYVQSIKQQEQ